MNFDLKFLLHNVSCRAFIFMNEVSALKREEIMLKKEIHSNLNKKSYEHRLHLKTKIYTQCTHMHICVYVCAYVCLCMCV